MEINNTHLLIIIGFLVIILLVFMMALVGVLIYFLVKLKDKTAKQTEVVVAPTHQIKAPPPRPTSTCTIHKDVKASGTCAVCDIDFCEECLYENDKTLFCSEHYKYFLAHKWKEQARVQTTPHEPLAGMDIYHEKQRIFREEKTPCFLRLNYHIEIETDQIETEVRLFVPDGKK